MSASRVGLWSVVTLLVVLVSFAESAETPWKAGSAAIKITPEDWMWMSGYGGRDRPAEGKLTDLWVKALVLEDSTNKRAVLLTMDLVGIGRKLSLEICDALREQYGMERDQIAICTSHTHTGPALPGNLAPLHYRLVDDAEQKRIREYAAFLKDRSLTVVGKAIGSMQPSQLSWGSGRADFAVNRRNNTEAKVPEVRTEGKLIGPVDHDVPVLAVRDAEGKLTSVVFGYACHSTVLSFYQWSGDYPGFAQTELEASHPGCVALFFAGCGADQNPLPRRTVELARHYGRRLATAVDSVLLTQKMRPLEGKLATNYQEIPLAFDDLPTVEQIRADAKSENRFVVSRAKMLLEQIEEHGSLHESYPYPIGTWKIGEQVGWVFLGGEVVVDYAVRLKSEMGGPSTWVAGYANDVMAYIPSLRVLREGGYEGAGAMVYYGLPTTWSTDVEEAIVEKVHSMLTTGAE